MANGKIIEWWAKRENCCVAMTDGSGASRNFAAQQKPIANGREPTSPDQRSARHGRVWHIAKFCGTAKVDRDQGTAEMAGPIAGSTRS
jgi:hypothetical protein